MYSIQFMEDIEKENYSCSGQVSPILMNFGGVAQKNFSYYNKDNIDLNRFFEKMTFQDLYNDFAEENTPSHSGSNVLQPSASSSINQSSSSQLGNTPSHINNSSSSTAQMPLQEYSNNYQNMNYRNKVSLQHQSSFCSQASTASSSVSYSTSSNFPSNPFSNITNIKNNNCSNTVMSSSQMNTPSHFNSVHSQHQQQQSQQQQHLHQIPFHKQTSLKLERKPTRSIKLKNAIDEFFGRSLDSKFQQKIASKGTTNTYPSTTALGVNSTNSVALSNNISTTYSDQNCSNFSNTYDLFSQSTSNSCYSLFMSQQNSQCLSECDTNSEYSVY